MIRSISGLFLVNKDTRRQSIFKEKVTIRNIISIKIIIQDCAKTKDILKTNTEKAFYV